MKTRDPQSRDLLARIMWQVRTESRKLPPTYITPEVKRAAEILGFNIRQEKRK